MRGTAHIQGPEKFACQNEVVLSLLTAVNSTSVIREGKSLCIYIVLFQVACVPLRKSRGPFGGRKFPPDFGGANFPAPGQQRGYRLPEFDFFHSFPECGGAGKGEEA